ncbi:glutathione S-transferase N-terminal domain-containing protein [Nannocystis sp. RBIL2]|uniref:glutathione S-transferase family protein n=1 Tax=Nannocystis sp. RBIL2 TaxID=2996788 RepID=UPI002270B611|nr:glutathione S-transferase N-terminal domain-containing protein [Nannocystis sp. RBIL2]MCY1066246.1 glutathione S-transferase N-terminal domain-containing protein [Nannocystis sp. RBIL2]
MKVYGHPMSTCTRKVLMTLAEKGHRADFVMVDIMKGEGHNAEHLARQPWGQIPAFEDDDGWQMYESRAICRYLDAKLSGPSLMPADLRQRALVEQWISIETSNFTAPAMKIIYNLVFGKMFGKEPDMAAVEEGRKGVKKAVAVMERQLENRNFLVGDGLTLADIFFMPYIEYLAAAGELGLIDASERVGHWWRRLSERPTWQQVSGRTNAAS